MDEGEERKEITSLSYNDIGDERLKLIDISSEDDFLIASPLFESLEDLRLSVTWDKLGDNECFKFGNSSSNHGATQCNFPPQSGRPSYLRRSLAWDNAFFTSSGVLDPDELSLINKGANFQPPSQQDAHIRTDNTSVKTIGKMTRAVSKRDHAANNQRPSEEKFKIKQPKVPTTAKKFAFGSLCSISSRFSSSSSLTPTVSSSVCVSSFAKKESTSHVDMLFKRSSSTKASSTLFKDRLGSGKNISSISSTSNLNSQISLDSADSPHQVTDTDLNVTPRRSDMISSSQEATDKKMNSKPSRLRLPSPKIGFFEEVVLPKAKGLLKFQIGKGSKSSVDRTPGGNNGKHQKPKVSSSLSTQPRSAPSLRRLNSTSMLPSQRSVEIDREKICKWRKVGFGEHERRSGTGMEPTSMIKRDERRLKGKLSHESGRRCQRGGDQVSMEEGVNDLSRRFETIDLWDDLKTIRAGEGGGGGNKECRPSRCISRSRTPLAEKTRTSLCINHNAGNPPVFTSYSQQCFNTDKENI
ncbi:unnamed protein product [Cuscuta epithymum]|uniref:Uncharacterized protein n=1 Tax=Cuscuta epithymum TaxID=186058 RepID=A0AAV0F3M1_9ASTE|nr:unnamed protein product [Cuscuta epithymum]